MNTTKRNPLDAKRGTAIIVGTLFIIATGSYMLGTGIIDPILNATDYLIEVSVNENQMVIGNILEFVNHIAVICIPFMMFPIFRKHNEALALGYSVFRVVEAVTLIVGNIILLSILTLSQEFVSAGAPDASYFLTTGSLIMSVRDWSILLGVNIIFPLGALIFNLYLYQTKLVPRWLSGWGFIGAILLLGRLVGLLAIADFDQLVFLTLPIWVQEMVFALWLIVKGFNSSAIVSEVA
jgi:hypothetical protein